MFNNYFNKLVSFNQLDLNFFSKNTVNRAKIKIFERHTSKKVCFYVSKTINNKINIFSSFIYTFAY